MLRYRAQAPVVDGLMRELGFTGHSLDEMVASATADGANGAYPRIDKESRSLAENGSAKS